MNLRRNTRRFFTTRRYPIFYLSITKCGCTYLKNLMYYLDHDQMHPMARFIHDQSEDLIRAEDRDPRVIVDARHVFTVLRDPVDRFFSLYFDKIHGERPQNFAGLREILAQDIGLDLTAELTPDAHSANAFKLINWIDANLREETPEPVNPHWKPQHERIEKVADFGVWRLTLEGLDWQLPLFLQEVIPDLPTKMTAISERNTSSRAKLQTAVTTPELHARICEIYAQDAENHAQAVKRWAKRRKRAAKPQPVTPPELPVLTTHRAPINTRIIPKCGSTYLRNLFYQIDHGQPHPDPNRIDADNACITLTKDAARLDRETNFVVFRDPVERFLSFYFDKVWGQTDTSFPWIAQRLAETRKFRFGPDIDAAAHHDNCCRLLGMLETRFAKHPTSALNPHWRPQSYRLSEMRATGFKPLLLEALDMQLPIVLQDTLPDIAEHMAKVPSRNTSTPPFPYDRFRTPYILDRLQALYADDMSLHARLTDEWQKTGQVPKL